MKQSTRISKDLLARIRTFCDELDPKLTVTSYIESRLEQALVRDKNFIDCGKAFQDGLQGKENIYSESA